MVELSYSYLEHWIANMNYEIQLINSYTYTSWIFSLETPVRFKKTNKQISCLLQSHIQHDLNRSGDISM